MKQIKHVNEGREYLLVGVPEGSHAFAIVTEKENSWLTFYDAEDDLMGPRLPEGQWQIVGKADTLSEQEARGMISPWGYGYKGYPNYTFHDEYILHAPCSTAIDSLNSLLEKHSLTPSNTIILAKQ